MLNFTHINHLKNMLETKLIVYW